MEPVIEAKLHPGLSRSASHEAQIAAVFAGRYRVTRTLHSAPGSETLLAVDDQTRESVIIKEISLSAYSAGARLRLEHEQAVLEKIENNSLAAVREIGRGAVSWYCVRSFVSGQTLADRLRDGPLSLALALHVGRCLLNAIQTLHGQAVLHRNIKPANLIIAVPSDHGADPLSRAVLVDGGFWKGGSAEPSAAEPEVAEAMYLSPEQAGLIDCGLGEPSDLYAAGLVLFECICGRPPFAGDTVSSILLQHMTAEVARLHTSHAQVPRALDDLIHRLLRKDPRDRYQSASAVLDDLEQIASALASGDRDPNLVLGRSDRRRTLTAPAFVSRRREMDELGAQLSQAKTGQGGLVLVEGESGRGKSRLLTELAQRAGEDGFWVLRGQGRSEVGQKPLQLLEGILQGLLAAFRSDPSLLEQVRGRLGDQCEAVAAALPELAPVLTAAAHPDRAPEAFGEARSIEALADFLDVLGSAARPALVILDDCQWADDLMIRLIARWQARRQGGTDGDCHALLLVSFRSDEVAASHRLHKLPASARIRLSPFDASEIRQLVESMAGPLPQDVLDLVLRLSDGSPFMASAVLYGLVESEALVADAQGWRVEPLKLTDLKSSESATAFLLRRIELLHPHTIEVLWIGAVLGKEFELEIAAALMAKTPAQFMAALEEARQRHLVWLDTTSSHGMFVHDRIREALLERLPAAQRRKLHARAAAYLQKESRDRVFDLAYHFDAAGEHDWALPYALAAAEQARTQHSLQVAEQQYEIAERGARATDNEVRYRIAAGHGEVKMLRGDYAGAAKLLERAARFAEGKLARAQNTLKLGELAFKRGEMESATESFEQALRQLGRFVPRSYLMILLLLAWEAAVQGLHTLLPRLLVARRKRPPSDDELLCFRIFSRLAHGYWFIRGKAHVLWAHVRGMNLAERYAPTLELAQSYSEHAPAMSLVPWYGRGIDYAVKSLLIRKSLGDVWGQGQSLHYHGIVLYVASRYHECVEKCREAVRLLERMGDYWEVHIARYQIAAALYRLGDLQGAVDEARRIHASGVELGDYQASGISLDVWARASEGAVPPEVMQPELARHRHDAQGTAQVLLGEGVCRMGAHEHAQAAATFERALSVARLAGVMNAYVSPNWAWLASALRMQAENESSCIPVYRRRLLGRAAIAAGRAVWLGLRFRNDLPHALREAGLALATRGRVRTARAVLGLSLRIAKKHQAQYEAAQTLQAQARIARELGRPGADDDARRAEALLRDLKLTAEGAAGAGRDTEFATFSLIDRFDVVLDAGRRIGSALTADDVFSEVREAARRLLRGEYSEVVPVTPGKQAPTETSTENLSRQSGEWFCNVLMVRALETGRVATLVEQNSDRDHAGVAAARSALCAPIFVRGAAIACLCVTHKQVRGLFGKNEERLADFITAIAGAALENADGFLRLQQLNATLEERVAERAAAAEGRARELAVSNRELERIAAELRIAEEQLRIAKDAAESATRAKSRFLATMSHEIRTPMNGVIGMTELALKTSLTSQQQSYLQVVKQSADALLRLLNDILDFSKVEAGKLELEQVPFDLRETVGDAIRVHSVRASQNNLELNCQIAPEVPCIVAGDAGRLRQILVNLVGNAIKFTPQGEIEVDVGLVERHEADVVLHFSVRDTGIGISPEKQQRIFDSFSQADSSITRRFGGTGLGLSISAQLVELMQGKLSVESRPEHGSTFHFTVRFAVPEGASAASGAATLFPPVNVLIFDDHPTSRSVLTKLLGQLGLKAQAVSDRHIAVGMVRLAALANNPFRLILIDGGMPEQEGWALAKHLRAMPESGDMPIVFLTPPSHIASESQVAEVRGARQLTKPAKASEMIDAVRSALENAAPVDAIQPAVATLDRPARILLVEDGPVNQEVAQGLLEMQGYHVEIANNGREALEILERQSFDVVLMDLEMPEMDGLSATAEIRRRELETNTRVPIIAMTAHAVSALRAQCFERGMDGYLTKPIQPQELFDALDRVQHSLEASLALAGADRPGEPWA